MPGNSGLPARAAARIRLSRSSSLTERRVRRPAATASRSAPSVVGTDIRQYKPVARIPWLRSSLLSLSEPVVIAHRGGSRLRPENTLASFDHAIALGVDALECDVHLSRDGEPVVIHDATLDRTTDAIGPVARPHAPTSSRGWMPASGSAPTTAHPFRGRGIGVPRLATLLERYPADADRHRDQGRPAGGRRASARGRARSGRRRPRDLRRLQPRGPRDAPPAGAGRADQRLARRDPADAAGRRRLDAARRAGYRLVQVPLRFDGRQVFGPDFVRAVRAARLRRSRLDRRRASGDAADPRVGRDRAHQRSAGLGGGGEVARLDAGVRSPDERRA